MDTDDSSCSAKSSQTDSSVLDSLSKQELQSKNEDLQTKIKQLEEVVVKLNENLDNSRFDILQKENWNLEYSDLKESKA